MRNQNTQLGILLKKLRTRLGYSIEDWAQIFDIEPLTVVSIEAGHEMSNEFLIGLVKWVTNGLEHPQTPTEVLPDGWQVNLPNAIQTLLDTIEKKDALIEDLQNAYNLQKITIDQSQIHIQGHHQQIENYLNIVSKQQEKITTLEQLQSVKHKTTKAAIAKHVLACVTLLLVGGVLFKFITLPPSFPKNTALAVQPPPTIKQLLSYKAKVRQKQQKPQPLHSKEIPVRLYIKKRSPQKTPHLGKPVLTQKQQVVKGINRGLSDLMAMNSSRKGYAVEKALATEGHLILKFNNPSQQQMTIVVNDSLQKKVYEKTTKANHYLLDTSKFSKGKYYYWVYIFPDVAYQGSGSFVVKKQE